MSGTIANGSTLILNNTTISEILSISGPNYSSDIFEITNHGNTDDFKTFKKGFVDAGEITVDGLINYADYNTLASAIVTSSLYSATITFPTTPSTTIIESNVYVTSLEPISPCDGLLEFSATMKISGKPALNSSDDYSVENIVNTTISVLTSSTQVMTTNINRTYVLFINESAQNIYLSFGNAAELHKGIWLKAFGGYYEVSYNILNLFSGVIYAIADNGTGTLLIIEGLL